MTNSIVLPTAYQQFIHLSRYARFDQDQNRRETFSETIARLENFYVTALTKKFPQANIQTHEYGSVFDAVARLDVLPSMRALMAAGPAAEKSEVALYNCSYIAVDNPRAFDEALYVLMCGTGLGFSVERQHICQLPEVPVLHPTDSEIIVEDSKTGWAVALKQLVSMLYAGSVPKWNDAKVRPAGSVLKTFGGRASGPAPLRDLYAFFVKTFKTAQGRKLTSLECHDLMCMIGQIVVVGGVRRSALISLSNLSDQRLRDAKTGQWWEANPQRALANNSVAYTEKPDVGQFMEEWTSLYKSHSGERGIFNRSGAQRDAVKLNRDGKHDYGTNPCGEIILRSQEFCNLTEAVARPGDTVDTLAEKIKIATILGTWQSTFTDFKYLRKRWKDNCEEERLLGVSITGIMDTPLLNTVDQRTRDLLEHLKELARVTNKAWADRLDIPPSAAITCVKPSGTASQMVNSASGIHARYSKYYIRRVRQDSKDPLTSFMQDQGFPWEQDVMNPSAVIFSFPIEAPFNAVVEGDRTPLQVLEHWLMFKQHFTEHNPSTTISVPERAWPEVGAWVWNNFDVITGLSFLPEDLGTYKQAPMERCTEAEYKAHLLQMPQNVDWTNLKYYESTDETKGSQQLACTAGNCDI